MSGGWGDSGRPNPSPQLTPSSTEILASSCPASRNSEVQQSRRSQLTVITSGRLIRLGRRPRRSSCRHSTPRARVLVPLACPTGRSRAVNHGESGVRSTRGATAQSGLNVQFRPGFPWSAGQCFPSSEREFDSRHPLRRKAPGQRPGACSLSRPIFGARTGCARVGDREWADGASGVGLPNLRSIIVSNCETYSL
jgi:hypothetical protein